ncbi:hypothetical protein [Micromonospora avicenniae]|uniref:thiolase family protein n=1 Tax=Micromonospora avicenniae TaxID=1198245 RepID=UPI0034414AE3
MRRADGFSPTSTCTTPYEPPSGSTAVRWPVCVRTTWRRTAADAGRTGARAGTDRVDEIVLGKRQGRRGGHPQSRRMAGLPAGLPTAVPATTVNWLCGSSLDAAIVASRQRPRRPARARPQ